jgi:hypothetical protein
VKRSYVLSRFLILRLLGLCYLAAFVSLADQVLPLVGHDGLLPADRFLERVGATLGSGAFFRLPSLFWLGISDSALLVLAWCGAALSLLVAIGFANAIAMAVLWALYMSFVHIGQTWYGFGWEIQLLETGFLAIFLCPLLDPRPFREPPVVVLWLYRWLILRIMLGAGLIKLRGDPCWRELTCLVHHYETQPIPNPLSRTLHFMPLWFHQAGVLYNHLAELVAPLFVFGPRPARLAAGLLLSAFQLMLILSGNLSFLNWLTLVPVLACFDDAFLEKVLPRPLVARAERARNEPSTAARRISLLLAALIGALSIAPVANLLSGEQLMNASFEPLALVNTYGAFGSVGKTRHEIVFEGTREPTPGPGTVWREYEFKCKPGDPARRPCVITPYHYRLDWQIWFAAMASPEEEPWAVHLVYKLLLGDPGALSLLAGNPFPEGPPTLIRARLYRYAFAPPSSGRWWDRTLLGEWLPPLSLHDRRLLAFLAAEGFIPPPSPEADGEPDGEENE